MSVKIKLVIAIGLVLAISLSVGCTPAQSFGKQVNSIVNPYRFSILDWELKTLLGGDRQSNKGENIEDGPGLRP